MRRVAMGRISEIWEGDRLIQDFGMKLLEAREGYAKVSVEVRGRFLNAHGIGHGVLIFAVADAAFALSVNAVVDAVGVQWSLNVFRAAKPGEEVIGESRIIHKGRQSMVCELTVTAGDGRIRNEGGQGRAGGRPQVVPARIASRSHTFGCSVER
jgi:acyl-CoA thioesterase